MVWAWSIQSSIELRKFGQRVVSLPTSASPDNKAARSGWLYELREKEEYDGKIAAFKFLYLSTEIS